MKYHTKRITLKSGRAGRLVRHGSRFMVIDDATNTRSDWSTKTEIAHCIRTQPRKGYGSDLSNDRRNEMSDLTLSQYTTQTTLRIKVKKRRSIDLPVTLKTNPSGLTQMIATIQGNQWETPWLINAHEAEKSLRNLFFGIMKGQVTT